MRPPLRGYIFRASLYIDKIVDKLERVARDEEFWADRPPSEWYPPTTINVRRENFRQIL